MRWDKERRDGYYAMVRRNRGDVAARALVMNVNLEWKRSSDENGAR